MRLLRRGPFLRGLGAGFAACALGRPACAAPVDVSDIVAGIPGVTGVVARTMDPARPAAVSIRAEEPFASASVIKLAIMATVFRAYDAGTASPSDGVRTRATDLIGGSDVLAGTPPGKRWRLDALVNAMIHVSDNAASNTLITAFGMRAINATMKLAGMQNSRLGRHFADVVPAWHRSENLVTPGDVASLLFQIEKGAREGIATLWTPLSCRRMIQIMLGNDDRTKIVRGLPHGVPVAHKTGEISGVRNDAGIVDPFGDDPYLLVVLTKDLRDQAAGNRGIAQIAARVDRDLRVG